MDVSIIIVNYRTPELIINCLTSIYTHTAGVELEIIIVDNDPQNGGGDLIRNVHPQVKWIDMEYNSGFGIANNRGMSLATGNYFLLLNADTLLTDNVIGRCFERLNRRQDVIACGALQHYLDGKPMPFLNSFNAFRKTLFILPMTGTIGQILNRFLPEPSYDDPAQCDWLVGAFMFIRKSAFESTKGFDEDFFMYAEDIEWSARLNKLGKLCYFSDCHFIHLENENPFRRTNISWINRFSTQMQVSNMLWIRKQYGLLPYLTLLLHYISMIPVIYVWKIAVNLTESRKPLAELKTQTIFTRKTQVLLRYFWRTALKKPHLYRISPSDNIDLLTRS